MVRSNRLLSRRSDIGEDEIDINNSNEDEEEDRPNKTMMQVLDGRTGKILDVDCMNRHRQVVSKMAINDAQDYLVSSSTDGTVRVWTFTYDMKAEKREALPPKERNCPLRCMHVLQHESGWVHDVSIQGTTIVSGGGDCAFRIWDARTGEQLYSLTGLHRRHSLGVQAIALQGSLIATGSPFDRYCVWQTDSSNHPYRIGQEARNSSGESSSYDESEMAAIVDCSRTTNFRGPYRLLHVLDEPLTSREHHHFENVESQYYRTRVVITPTVYITNSKRRGMLCIWSRTTGRMLHRIWVTSVMTGLLPKEAQVNKPDGPSFHSPFYHHNAPVDTIDGAMDNGSIPAATQRQKVAGDAYSMRVVSFADNAFVDTDEPHPLHGHGEDSFDDDEEVDYSPEDEVMCERIHDFETDATGEFLMVTMTTGRMVLFQFGASPMDRPIKLQPRMLRTMDDEIVSSARV
ncbi:hypothetical protein BGZ73_000905 [Actinomortierella ambigua]|nr:hypothetical protein BGZ73_000905 [Actinomortierella ambigua]